MKRIALLLACTALAACTTVDTTGLSDETSREPKGDPTASVRVEEFGDLQCPACRSAHMTVVQPLLAEYGDEISFVYNHFPLRQIHPFALSAAEASECAADQGFFWQYVDTVYENQSELNTAALTRWASEFPMDQDLFARCLDSGIKRQLILDDYNEGVDRGVTGTPTFFVNGERIESSLSALSAAIENAKNTQNTMPL